ncbi:Leucine Rich repeat family protein [Leishmania donovani]|uniref:Leucine Rich repeat family protein n=1 Tax=Leishmania donovani TaxID=5661 RepID=A0A504X865_LEIDO|nr:Leucine Rich repeat family protein [Leishmania donovani]
MSSSSTGPARLLLNSFTVAATPQTLSVSNAEDEDRSDGTALTDGQDADAQVHARPTISAFAGAISASVEGEEEEPRPSSAAPLPAPAPPPSSQPASSPWAALECLSSPIVNTSPHSRRYSFSSLHSRQRVWGAPMGSRAYNVGRTGDDLRGIPATPFRWRSSLPHAAGTSLLKPGQHDFRHATTTTATLHPERNRRHVSEQLGRSPTGAFTPHIRYRTSSGGSPGARAASGGLSTSDANASVNCDGESRHRHVSPVCHAPAESAPHASIPSAHAAAPFLRPPAPAWSFLLHPHDNAQGASFLPPPPLLATTHQGGAAVSTMSSGCGAATRSARVVTLCAPAETTAQEDGTATPSISDVWVQQERRNQALRRGHCEPAEEAEAAADMTRGSSHASVNHAGAVKNGGGDSVTEPVAIGHLTLRSLTEEYNRFSTEGTVGWIGLQVHLRRHTQTNQIFALDLTCCHMRRDQWTWFSQDILPQLRALEVLRLVQMHLEDDEVAELVRGSCGLSAAADGRRSAGRSWQQSSLSASRHKVDSGRGGRGSGDPAVQSAPLAHLRVLDLSGNAFTQRSCTHLGKMMLWMAGTLEEVRLLGNPLKDYGMQTLSVYVAKLNLEALEQDPSLFPAALRDCCAQVIQKCGRGHARRSRKVGSAPPSPQPAAAAGVMHAGYSEGESRGDARGLVAALPLGPVLLDLRDCRASARGLSDILAAASRAHRLRTLVLSHNVAGVTSLLPLPASAHHEAANLAKEEAMESEEREARARSGDGRGPLPRLRPLPCRLRLAKTPLVYSGALMRGQHTALSDVAGFATSCALSTLVLYGVPLSQTCSPLGFRELLLNIFFSCPLLDLVDLSDTFEWSLVPPEAQKALLAEANCRDSVEQRLRSPEAQRGLHVHREHQGEVEFRLDSATVSNQTRLGDMFGELMAHVAFNAVVRRRLPPAAFLHVRELHLSNTGLTDAGARGLCVSVRRGRSQTGMLASLAVLNLSDNLLTVRGCVRVISAFLLDGDAEVDVDATRSCLASLATTSTAARPAVIARLTALALQRNSGFVSARGDGTAGGVNGASDDGAGHLQQVCTAAETAVLRRATLRSAVCSNQVHGNSSSGAANAGDATQEERAPPLTVYFSAPPSVEATSSISSSGAGGQRRPSAFLASTASPASAQAVEKEDTNTRGLSCFAQQKPCSSTEVSRALAGTATAHGDQTASALAVSEMTRGGCGALGTDATPTAGKKQQHRAQDGPQRNLFAALGAPRDAVAAAGTGAGGESPNGLVNTTPLHHLRNFTNDVEAGAAVSAASVSSSSFPLPPPPSDSVSVMVAARHTSDLATAGVGPRFLQPQQQQQTTLLPRRESGLSVPGGSNFGALFMSKAEKTPPITLGAPAGAVLADAAAGARAALEQDLLAALKRASAASKTRSTSAQGGDEGGGDGGGAGKAASATTTAESVRYLPPGPPSATVADGGDSSQLGADVHWMRFEVTTGERKGDMAQLLQEVLNVPLPEQRVLFERLLQFLTQHVTCGEDSHGTPTAEDLWDPVRAIEQAARSSAAVRARLEIAYGGVAEAAVHARHQYHGAADATLVPINDAGGGAAAAAAGALDDADGTEGIVRLDRLYFALWRELGMPVGDTARDALPHAPSSVCIKERGAETPAGSDGRPDLLDRTADGGGLYTSFSTPHDVLSCRSSEAAVALSPQPSAATHPPRPHAVNFYDGVGGEPKPRQRQSLPATVHQGQCAGAFAPAAAAGGDQGGAKWTTSRREGAEREEGDEGASVDSTSVTTPEKQLNHTHCIELGSAAAALSPSPLALANSNAEVPQPDSPSVEVVLADKLMRLSPPAKTRDAAGAAVAPPLAPQLHVSRASLTAAEDDEKGQQHVDDFNAERNALRAVTSRLLIDKRSDEERSGSSGRAGSPARSGGTLLSQPQQKQSEGCQQTQPELVHAGATGVQAEEAEGEEDVAIVSPIRVQRRSSQLIGRVKTFTLSYTHQEGTAVCRAWRLLHTATHVCRSGSTNSNNGTSVAPADAVAPIAPSSPPSLAALAKEAQRCLCDDFLAFLQPPDEDAEHAVLSVSLHCDSGVATAMLQVQVQTNERRAVLADRLQHSNHGVRRSVGRGSRSGLVPLSVQEVDQFYFPRLTRLLRQYKTVADTAAQVQAFLQPRAAVQARLLQSHGSVAALVHYYHGSQAALEHELGISSWQVLMDPALPSTARAEQLKEEVMSPTVAVDRVLRRERAGVESNQGGSAPRVGSGDTGEDAPGTSFPQGANAAPSSPPQPTAAGTRQPSCPTSADGSVTGATNLQGRPPTRPRRPPTPPHAITHTSSISFDEVTEEPTSEAGPVVVLRGTAPAPAPRSPSSPQSLNPQYFPAMYRQVVSTTLPSRAGVEDVPERSALNEPGGPPDGGSDTGLVSPLTAVSSAAGSPTSKHLGLALEQPAPTVAVAASENSLSPLPVPRVVRQLADGTDSVAAPAAKKGGGDMLLSRSDASGNPSATAVTASSSSSLVMPTSKTRPVGGTNAAVSPVPLPRLPVERDNSNTAGHSNASSRSLEPSHHQPGAAAGAGSSSSVAGSDRCKSEYERVLEGKYKRLMRVAYDGVARGSVPLDPQHQQKTVIGRGKWGTQKVELSLEWEILFVLTFEKSRKLGRSSRRAQMLVHPVGCGFECAAGDDLIHTASSGIYGGENSSLHSSAINGESGDGGHHLPATAMPKIPRKRESSKSSASHLVITIQRPFTPDEVGSSSHDMEETLMAGALLTVSSSSKAAWLLVGGNDETSTTSRASAGVNQVAHEYVFQLCQASLTLDIEMKSSKHVQEALRLLKNSIRRATQAVKKSMLNAHIPPPSR